MKNPDKTVTEILQAAFRRKKISRPGYSLRALARDLGVSGPFASNILSGKKSIPKERLAALCQVLEMDLHERDEFLNAALRGTLLYDLPRTTAPRTVLLGRKSVQVKNDPFFSSWKNVAVLEALTLDPPHNDLGSIQVRLKLTNRELHEAIQILFNSKLIEVVKGEVRKTSQHQYFASGRSKKIVRELHKQFIAKARAELETRTADEDYRRRLINGFTFATHPAKIEKLKKKILEFLDELSLEASDGACTEVYQCNVQFFPLTEAKNRAI